jgi:hypothetical protein
MIITIKYLLIHGGSDLLIKDSFKSGIRMSL